MLIKRLVKKILAHILIWGILISCIGPTVSVEAVTESENVIERAVNWLKNNQNDDGSWGNYETNFLDTSVVSEYISENMVIGESLQQAISWMEGIQILNNDMAARILPYIKDTEKHTSIKNSLIINQNNDGGWGISKGYESDMLDTIIVLNSLRTEENVDISILKKAVTYIMNMQHTNGSWSFTSSEETAASLTAQTVITLNSFRDNTSLISDELQTAMRKAGEYLVSIQNADRTWGTDESSIIGTLLAYRAVLNTIGLDAVDTVAASILDVQSTDGSWYGSPYITTLAITAIKENINMPFAKINSIKLFKYVDETRTECYSYNAYETFEIDADCVNSNEDVQILYFIKQKDGSVSSAQTDGIPGWNTRNYMPGDYSVVVQIKDNLSGKVIASGEKQFVINPSFEVENVICQQILKIQGLIVLVV